ACQKSQACKRLEEGTIGRNNECCLLAIRISGFDLPWNDDPVCAPNRVVAERLGLLRRLHQGLPACGAAGNRKNYPNLHLTAWAPIQVLNWACFKSPPLYCLHGDLSAIF